MRFFALIVAIIVLSGLGPVPGIAANPCDQTRLQSC